MQVFRHVYLYQYILFINVQLTTKLKAIAKLSTPYLSKSIQAIYTSAVSNFCIKICKTIWVRSLANIIISVFISKTFLL